MESDIDPQSGFRLPLLKRDDLDDVAKQAYDEAVTPGRSVAGLQGPAGVQLYAGKALPHLLALTRYLRNEAGFSGRIREIAILAVAREMDSQVQWTMHEAVALKEGVEPATVDIIRHRESTDGLDDADAAVIDLARETYGSHKVSPRTFARATAAFGPHRLVGLLLLMGNCASTAGMLIAVDMQLHANVKPTLPIP
jgi:4-carboxymuconolactone decarboxylase